PVHYSTSARCAAKKRRPAQPSRRTVGAPTDESHAHGRDRATPAVVHTRVRVAPRQRAGAVAVRCVGGPVRSSHHRGRAQVPLLKRDGAAADYFLELLPPPNVTPTVMGTNFVEPPLS